MIPAALALAVALSSASTSAPSAPKLDPTRHGPDVPGTVESLPAVPAPAPGSVLVSGVAWHESEVRFDDPPADTAALDDAYTAAEGPLPLRVPTGLDGRTVRAIEARF